MNILVFHNPTSRSGKPGLVRKLLGKDNDITLCETRKPNDIPYLAQQIKNEKYDTIVSIGGDGFLNEVINGMLSSGLSLPVGIIPAGSMNVFALSAGIPKDTEGACKVILERNKVKVDLGKVTNDSHSRYFIAWAGIGYDTHIIRLVNRFYFIKRKLGGLLAHLIMGIYGFITYSGTDCTVEANDTTSSGCNLIVSNISCYASHKLQLAKNAEINDGYLHARLLKGGRRIDIIRYLVGLATGRHEDFEDVECIKFREMKVTSKEEIYIHADAEELEMKLPGKIEAVPGAIEVILPKKED